MTRRRFTTGFPWLSAFLAVAAPVRAQDEPPPAVPVTTVVIDAGHGGDDFGVRRDNLLEKDLTLALAKAVARALAGKPGLNPFLTRRGDYPLSYDERRRLANLEPNAIVLSLHFGSAPSPLVSGTRLFLSGGSSGSHGLLIPIEQAQTLSSALSLRLASDLTETLRDFSPTVKAQVAQLDLAPLLGIVRPAVLIEADYITSADAARWTTPEVQNDFARALVRGIDRFASEGKNPPP